MAAASPMSVDTLTPVYDRVPRPPSVLRRTIFFFFSLFFFFFSFDGDAKGSLWTQPPIHPTYRNTRVYIAFLKTSGNYGANGSSCPCRCPAIRYPGWVKCRMTWPRGNIDEDYDVIYKNLHCADSSLAIGRLPVNHHFLATIKKAAPLCGRGSS